MHIKKTKLQPFLLYCATAVLGIDYVGQLLFPSSISILNVNRVLFFAIFTTDFFSKSRKYLLIRWPHIFAFVALMACTPYLLFAEQGVTAFKGVFDSSISLIGIGIVFFFFYVNCSNTDRALHVITILFTFSLVVVLYIFGTQFGIWGEKIFANRLGFQYERAAGFFDPNIASLYLLPCFAFGPLLFFHKRTKSPLKYNIFFLSGTYLSIAAAMFTNSRAGSIAFVIAIFVSLSASAFITSSARLRSRTFLFFGMLIFLSGMWVLSFKYSIFHTIVQSWKLTIITTDVSFSHRINSYLYILRELATSPSLTGLTTGYSDLWHLQKRNLYPHCTFIDMYINGGIIFLGIYIFLIAYCAFYCAKFLFRQRLFHQKLVFACFLGYILGSFPLLVTLSIGSVKVMWGIFGCVVGLANKERHIFYSQRIKEDVFSWKK